MDYERPDSEKLLKKIKYEEKQAQKKTKGKFRIFLGYAAGVGKTYAMLEAAHEMQKQGVDVVAGYIEPHAREDTKRMAIGFESIPVRTVEYKGRTLREFDLDTALKRHPKLILVDELAHTNAPGCRNEKRYQDVEELLRAGIDVWSTVNIQHLESLNDLVGSITKIEVKERIPDWVFDEADQVKVVDIEPDDLIERLQSGKVYKPEQAARALDHFFRKDKLVALREIALRRTADRVNRIAAEEKAAMGDRDYHTGEHVLVCISAAPSSAKVIRTAARLASAFHAEFTGLYVETPAMQEADEEAKAVVRRHIEMAKEFGAKIVTVYGTDVAGQIAEYAVVSNVSKVVLGRTNHKDFPLRRRVEVMEKLTAMAPNIDVYIIPDMKQFNTPWSRRRARQVKENRRNRKNTPKKVAMELLAITLVLLMTTLVAAIAHWFKMPESNIIMIYIFGVLLSSYVAYNKIYAVYSALVSVLAFNFFFTEPYFSLKAYDSGYPTTFFMLFVVGLFTASLTRKLKRQNRENAKKAYRTEILLENSQKLRRCKSMAEVWDQAASQVGKLLGLSLVIYPVSDDDVLGTPMMFPRKGMTVDEMRKLDNVEERGVAQWVVKNHHRAGACTHTLASAQAMYLPIQDAETVRGVIGLLLEERRPIEEFEYGLLVAMLNETGVKLQDEFL